MEGIGKYRIWLETHRSTLCLFQKLHFGNSSQKARKIRYQKFLVLSNFTLFLYFVPNVLSSIVRANKNLVLTRPSFI